MWGFIGAWIGIIICRLFNTEEKFSSAAWREEQKRKATTANDEELPINIVTASAFLHKEGFVPQQLDSDVIGFKYQDDNYVICISPDNYIQLSKGFSLDDVPQKLMESAMQTMADMRCCKIVIRQDTIVFTVETYVGTWTNFTTYFHVYMAIIEETHRRLYDCYSRAQSEDERLLIQARRSGVC